jgi:hypothetical protein
VVSATNSHGRSQLLSVTVRDSHTSGPSGSIYVDLFQLCSVRAFQDEISAGRISFLNMKNNLKCVMAVLQV